MFDAIFEYASRYFPYFVIMGIMIDLVLWSVLFDKKESIEKQQHNEIVSLLKEILAETRKWGREHA